MSSPQTSPGAQGPPTLPKPKVSYHPSGSPRRDTDSDLYDDTMVRPQGPGVQHGHPKEYRISTSSFFEELEEEQSAYTVPPKTTTSPARSPSSPNQPTLFKNKAARMGFNYMAPR